MGAALAGAALEQGHEVVIISGPVVVDYPSAAELIHVMTTDEMLAAAVKEFDRSDGAIGAAAPCDYMPRVVQSQKISKTGGPLTVELIETPDVGATLGQSKRPDQWVVGFALETEDQRFRATVKLERKHCDLMVSNGPSAIDANDNHVEVLDHRGQVLAEIDGNKPFVAKRILEEIDARLIRTNSRELGVRSEQG